MYRFSNSSYYKLYGVNPKLISLATLALKYSDVDFGVSEGVRSKERQRMLFKMGKSQTMNSKHLKGDAIDVFAWDDGVKWDFYYYNKINEAFKLAAHELNIDYVWGGDWHTFKDGVHFELDDNAKF